MVGDLFTSLLEDLSKILHYQLHVDSHNSCLIQLPTGITIQMEMGRKSPHFLIGSDLGNVPVGKYRENLFREALRANNQPLPRNGVFAYSHQTDHLVLFLFIPIENINAEKIAERLLPFGELAFRWKDAISQGNIPEVELPLTAAAKKERPFGF